MKPISKVRSVSIEEQNYYKSRAIFNPAQQFSVTRLCLFAFALMLISTGILMGPNKQINEKQSNQFESKILLMSRA